MTDIVERLCEEMHDRYEAAAIEAGWETNPRSRVAWADVPEANKATMRAAVAPIAAEIEQMRAERDTLHKTIRRLAGDHADAWIALVAAATEDDPT